MFNDSPVINVSLEAMFTLSVVIYNVKLSFFMEMNLEVRKALVYSTMSKIVMHFKGDLKVRFLFHPNLFPIYVKYIK